MKQIKEYLPLTSTGLFTAFNNPIWAAAFQDSSELDTYFYLRYGDRIANKLIDNYADSTGIINSKKNDLAKLIYDINSKKWEHLFGVYSAEYNPIENTDFIETITEVNANNRVIDTDNSNTRILDEDTTTSGTASTTSSATSNGSNSTDNNVYGFNSVSSVGSSEVEGSDSNTTSASTSTTSSGTTANDTTIRDTGREDSTITDNGTHTSEHRKHGNIGVLENQSMLQSEVDFWKWSFIDSVCKDICDLIALSIY